MYLRGTSKLGAIEIAGTSISLGAVSKRLKEVLLLVAPKGAKVHSHDKVL